MRRFDRNKKTFCSRKFHSLLLTASMSMGMEYLMLLSDSIIIGNIFGEAAIAASNLVSPIFSVAVFICSHGKRGSRYLRYALYNATKYVCHWNPVFAEYLAKKRAEGKHYNVALSHAMKKLVRLIYALQKSGKTYLAAA